MNAPESIASGNPATGGRPASDAAKDRFQRLSELFEAASRLPVGEIARFLAAIDDEDLRNTLVSMLEADRAGAPEVRTLVDIGSVLDEKSQAFSVPDRIGGYRVLSVIGYGASGVVLRARQPETDRLVAVKVLGTGVWNPHALARFRREIRLLGRLEHPGIARVYGAGTDTESTPARPYFVMEFVEGDMLQAWLRRTERSRAEIVRMFLQIVEAVGYAHGRGIVHRDLKPANIIVGAANEPKILDFGVAGMRADAGDDETVGTLSPLPTRSIVSQTGAVLGTVPYMAPEQFDGTRAVDARADLYAIGVMMYEALAKRPPYVVDHRGIAEAAITVSTEIPSTLGRIDRSLRGDLETVVAKLLEKDAALRYQSAGELAEDLRLFLEGRPTRTRPLSQRERARRFATRYRTLLLGTAAAFAVLTTLLTVTSILWRTAEQRSIELARALADTQRSEYLRAIRHADAALRAGLVGDAREVLESTESGQRGWEWNYLSGRAAGETRVRTMGRLPLSMTARAGITLVGDEGLGRSSGVWLLLGVDSEPKLLGGFPGPVTDLALSPDGDSWIAAVTRVEGPQMVRRTLDGSVERRFDPGVPGIWSVDWSPDGRLVAFAGAGAAFAVLDARDGRCVLASRKPEGAGPGRPGIVRFIPGREALVVAQSANAWIHIVPLDGSPSLPLDVDGLFVERVVVCPPEAPGREPVIVCCTYEGMIFRFDAVTGELLGKQRGHRGSMIRAVCAGPRPGQFTTGATDQVVRVWSSRDGTLLGEAIGSEREVMAVAIDEVDGALLAVGRDGKLRAWDVDSQVIDPVFREHRAWVYGVNFDAAGSVASTGGEFPTEDGRILLWDPLTRGLEGGTNGRVGGHGTIVTSPVADPQGRIAAAFWDAGPPGSGGVAFFDGTGTTLMRTPDNPPYSIALLHGGRLVVVRRFQRDALDVFTRSGELVGSLPLSRSNYAPPLIAMPDGTRIVTTDAEGVVIVSVAEDGGMKVVRRIALEVACRDLAVDGRGRLLATGSETGVVALLDLEAPAGEELRWKRTLQEGAAIRVALTPDGARLATAGGDVSIRIWDTVTAEQMLVLIGHGDETIDLAYSPDGHLLASGSIDRTVRVWDGRPAAARAGAAAAQREGAWIEPSRQVSAPEVDDQAGDSGVR